MLVNRLSAAEPSLAGLSVSAREVVLALKKRGEARASEIAAALGITPSGVRQHLSALRADGRSEEHTSELQSRLHLVCRLLLENKKNKSDSLRHCKSGD